MKLWLLLMNVKNILKKLEKVPEVPKATLMVNIAIYMQNWPIFLI